MSERLEEIKAKLSNFATTVWDISEDDYMYLYQQAELAEEAINDNRQIRVDFADEIKTLSNNNAKLRETLEDIMKVDTDYFADDVEEIRKIVRQALERESK